MEWLVKFWIVGLVLTALVALVFVRFDSHGGNEETHLCSTGEIRPGPMHLCACRPEWVGVDDADS